MDVADVWTTGERGGPLSCRLLIVAWLPFPLFIPLPRSPTLLSLLRLNTGQLLLLPNLVAMSSSRSSRRSSRTPRPPISSDSDDNLKFQLDEENTIGRSRKFKTKKWTVQRSVSKSGKPGVSELISWTI